MLNLEQYETLASTFTDKAFIEIIAKISEYERGQIAAQIKYMTIERYGKENYYNNIPPNLNRLCKLIFKFHINEH